MIAALAQLLSDPAGVAVVAWAGVSCLGVLVYAVVSRVLRQLDGGQAQARAAAAAARTPHRRPTRR